MMRGPLANPDFRAQFSGHETFPLRHLWLKKAYDEVSLQAGGAPKSLFSNPEAIVTFGVGKNMVSSIRHWALTCRVLVEDGDCYKATNLGDFLFSNEQGVDPFLEAPATLWLLHWLIAGSPERSTTWFYAFNHLTNQTFDHQAIAGAIGDYCDQQNAGHKRKVIRASKVTIKRDVECFLRSYVPAQQVKFSDDTFEPALVPLGLIRPISSKAFEFRKGAKPTLPDGILLFALTEFWERYAPNQNTLSVEALTYEPGSPGRVFKLDEASLVARLAQIEQSSDGAYLWTDTAGVRNVARRSSKAGPMEFLASAYDSADRRNAA